MSSQVISTSAPPPARLRNRAALALRAYEAVSDAIAQCGPRGSLKTVLAYLGGRRRVLAMAQGLPRAALYGVWRDGQLDPAHRTQVTYFGPGHAPFEQVVDAYAALYAQKPASHASLQGRLLVGTVQARFAGQTITLTQFRCDVAGGTPRNRRWLHTHWRQVAAVLVRAGELFEMALEPIDDRAALDVVADLHWWLTHAMPFAYGANDINAWLVAYIFRLRGHGGVRFAQEPAALAFVAPSPEAYRDAFAANLQFIPTGVPVSPMPAVRQLAHDARLGLVSAVRRQVGSVGASLAEPTGHTPLHLAAREGHRRVVAVLLRQGADVHAVLPDSQQTPLHLAARQGHARVVKQLLGCGAAVHVADFAGQTPLHVALTAGHTDVADLLVKHGAPVAAQDDAGQTPLHAAALLSTARPLARLLRAAGASAALTVANAHGETPLSTAALAGAVAPLHKLLKWRAPPPLTSLGDDTLHPALAQLSMAVLEQGGELHLFALIVRCMARGQREAAALLTEALLAGAPRASRGPLSTVVQQALGPGR